MVSILIPIHNTSLYLNQCFESISKQTYSEFEVIMIDDGSLDISIDICKNQEKKDNRFKLYCKRHGGQASTRNLCVKIAKGEFVTFVDSDDIIHPKYLETLIGLAKRKEYFITGVDFIRFSDDIPLVNGVMKEKHHYLPYDALTEMLYQNGHMINSACGKLFRREVIEGIWFKEGILYEDLEWMARVLERMPRSKRVGLCDAPLYLYRKREGSTMETFSRHRLDVLDVTREIEERALKSGNKGFLRAARDRRLSANFDIYMQLWKHCRHVENGTTSTENYDAHAYELVKAECWRQIKRLRMGSLINPHVRKKNKLGILLSFFGPEVCGAVGSRLIARLKK